MQNNPDLPPSTGPRLSKRERETLNKLAWGWSYPRIWEHLGINSTHFYTLAHQIRRKTGIRNTADPVECRSWQRGNRDANRVWCNPPPTPQQMEVMRLRAQDMDYASIAVRLGMGRQTAQNHCSQGCKRARIGKNAKQNRVLMLAAYFRSLDAVAEAQASKGKDPMDEF